MWLMTRSEKEKSRKKERCLKCFWKRATFLLSTNESIVNNVSILTTTSELASSLIFKNKFQMNSMMTKRTINSECQHQNVKKGQKGKNEKRESHCNRAFLSKCQYQTKWTHMTNRASCIHKGNFHPNNRVSCTLIHHKNRKWKFCTHRRTFIIQISFWHSLGDRLQISISSRTKTLPQDWSKPFQIFSKYDPLQGMVSTF